MVVGDIFSLLAKTVFVWEVQGKYLKYENKLFQNISWKLLKEKKKYWKRFYHKVIHSHILGRCKISMNRTKLNKIFEIDR